MSKKIIAKIFALALCICSVLSFSIPVMAADSTALYINVQYSDSISPEPDDKFVITYHVKNEEKTNEIVLNASDLNGKTGKMDFAAGDYVISDIEYQGYDTDVEDAGYAINSSFVISGDTNNAACPLVNNKQSVILEASYRQGTLNSWIVKAPRKNRPLPTCFKSGQRFGSFKEVQKQLDKESVMFDSEMTSYVLCHLRTDLQRRYNKIVSKWVKIDPYYPYDISDDGKASFDVIELELTEDEFDAMMETKLAFMDTNENLFPIQKVAMSNVGTLLDCASAFKQVDDHPLGSALLLAEKLSTKTMLKVLYIYQMDL